MKNYQYTTKNLDFIFLAKISDHKPVFSPFLLSWNILCRTRVGNNGFRMDEMPETSEVLYLSRLEKIACLINEWVKENPKIHCVCLQEAPYKKAHLDHFLSQLDWECFNQDSICFTQTDHHQFQNLTLCSKDYSLENITNRFFVSHDCQDNRYHVVLLKHKDSERSYHVANVHLQWFSKKKESLRIAGRVIVKELVVDYDCIVAGDFNQSLHWILEDQEMTQKIQSFYYPKENNISFSSKIEEGMHFNEIDGVILQ